MKKCNKCLEEKDILEYPKKGCVCKICISESKKKYYQENKDKIKESVKEYSSKNKESIKLYKIEYNQENYDPDYHRKYREENKELISQKKKDHYQKNKDRIKSKVSSYCEENREVINLRVKSNRDNNKDFYNAKNREYIKNKKANDPLFKLVCSIRCLISQSFKSQFTKKSKKTIEILGCSSFEEFKTHIESKFTKEMNWSNYATYWQLDHIIPISWANNEEEVYKLNHYSNFQPLFWKDNISKSNRRSG
jgi:hypothetical protein